MGFGVVFVVGGGGVMACGAVGDSSSAVYVDAFMRFWASAVRTGGVSKCPREGGLVEVFVVGYYGLGFCPLCCG